LCKFSFSPPSWQALVARAMSKLAVSAPWDASQKAALSTICAAAAMAFGMRSAVSLALLEMTRDKSMGVGPAEVGKLNSMGQLAYSFGKLFGGAGVDSLGGRKSLILIMAALCANFLQMARARGNSMNLSSAFASCRFVTAAVWSAAAVGIKTWFTDSSRGLALDMGQASLRLGGSFGSLLGGQLLAQLQSWRQLLAAFGALGAATGMAVALRLPSAPAQASLPAPLTSSNDEQNGQKVQRRKVACSVPAALRIAATSPKLWLLYTSTTMVTPTFDLVAIAPQFLSDTYGLDNATVGRMCTAFPLASLPAIYVARQVLERISPGSRAAFLASWQSMAVMGHATLASRPPQWMLTPALFAAVAGCAPSLSCVPPDWIARWAGPHAGLFSGLHDIAGNLLAMFIYARAPQIVQRSGWAPILRFYALQVGLGACCMAAFQVLETANPTTSSPFEIEEGGDEETAAH